MTHPTWADLRDYHCSQRSVVHNGVSSSNPFFEEMSLRRYNYSPIEDRDKFRLVFLKGVLDNPDNKTLRRKGRFIWCKNIKYAGRNQEGLRQIEFTVDKGTKVFTVSENNVLSVPSNSYINNNRFFRTSQKTFLSFSSVFAYDRILNSMSKRMCLGTDELRGLIGSESPYRPGTLVSPRVGYFYPEPPSPLTKDQWSQEHPYGIVLGPAIDKSDYMGRELYRVRFGRTTYEKVNPVQLEIINEV